ncbi:hypothetical protein MLD38_007132 [Melastoma candidum]|uniref:Uncharacterized protein n=1 Tax=Melastoma candidum TaxID=119954 RepID=A0ACB9RQ49_9MYRT|nr:hypothetical protein MLD38_007132 [Melastoma candidum]
MVLSNGAGTDAVKAIVLRLSSEKNIHIGTADALTKMSSLRILVMANVKYSGDPLYFPSRLCWIEWPGYSAPSIHFSGNSNNLVMLDVHNSCIQKLSRQFELLVRLKCINISGCILLMEIPDMSSCRNLEILDLSQCTSLVALDDSIGYLKKLIELLLGGCSNLTKLPDILRCRSLKVLYLRGCSKLVRLPDLSVCQNLEVLDLSGCECLAEVNDSVGFLEKLVYLPLEGCKSITRLPNRLKWRSLETFRLDDCYKLDKFPEVMDGMECLKELVLRRSGIKELPVSIENLMGIRSMILEDSRDLVNIPSSIYKLKNLELLNIQGCSSLEKFPRYIEGSAGDGSFCLSLLSLDLRRCNLTAVEFLRDISCFSKLQELHLSENDNVTEIPSLRTFWNLEKLYICECKRLVDIGELPANLRVLDASGCGSLQIIHGLLPSRIPNFDEINLSSCQELVNRGFNMASVLPLQEARKIRGNTNFAFTGSEIPYWMTESYFSDSVSFLVPVDTWDNLVGILACGAFNLEEGFFWKNKWFVVEAYVDDLYVGRYRYEFTPSDKETDVVWLLMLLRDQEVDHALLWDELLGKKTDSDHFTVSLGFRTIRGGVMMKCGFRLICKDEEIELQAQQLREPVYFY